MSDIHVLEETDDTRWIAELSGDGVSMPDGDCYVPQVRLESYTGLNMDPGTWGMIEYAFERLGNCGPLGEHLSRCECPYLHRYRLRPR